MASSAKHKTFLDELTGPIMRTKLPLGLFVGKASAVVGVLVDTGAQLPSELDTPLVAGGHLGVGWNKLDAPRVVEVHLGMGWNME